MDELQIELTTEDGEKLILYPVETTRFAGRDYLLAADTPEGDGNCYILRDDAPAGSRDAAYVFVEDDDELERLMGLFEELIDEEDISLQQ